MGLISRVSSRTYRKNMIVTRRARDAFKKGNTLPFSIHAKHSKNLKQTPHPDYMIMKKITWPSLPAMPNTSDRTVKQNRQAREFEENNLFGMDAVLGQELETVLQRVSKHGFVWLWDSMSYRSMTQ